MIPGTGPGRGVPWWRWDRVALMWRIPGTQGPEVPGRPREGRTVAVVRREDRS
jgi:hypothetical protein